MDDPSPDEFTGEHSGRHKGASTRETLVREITDFEGADLDVVKPEPAHEGYGTTFTITESTNEPSERPEQSFRFAYEIPRSPQQDPNLPMPEIVNF